MRGMKPAGRLARALRILAPIITLAVVELAIFWPLISHPGAALHDRSDTMLNTWIINWQAHQLLRAPLALFNAPIFHPLPDTLALSEIIWPAAPAAAPLLAATANPILVYNLTFLGSFFVAAVGMYALALYVTRNRLAALLAGLIYAFSPYQLLHLSQVQLISIGGLPLTLLYLEHFWTTGRRHDGLMLALFMAAQTLSAFYYGFQVALIVGLYVLIRLLLRPRAQSLRRLGQVLPWLALAALLILPFALPYLRVRAGLGLERSLAEAAQSGASLAEFFLLRYDNPLYPAGLRALAPDAGGLFPGLVVGLLALIGCIAWPVRRSSRLSRVYLIGLGFAALILALGPRLKLTGEHATGIALPFGWLFQHVPGMTVIRAPARFSATLYLVIALAAAAGAGWLLRRLPGRAARVAVMALLVALCLAEYLAGREAVAALSVPSLTAPPPAYAWLAQQPKATIVEFPLTSEMDAVPGQGVGEDAFQAWPDFNSMRYQYFGTTHWQPTVDGYSGFRPPHHRELGLTLASFPDARSITLLRGLDVAWILVHSQLVEAFQPGRAATLRSELEQAPGIMHVQDFGPDWLYRVEPARPAAVGGHFWATADGQASLILASAGEAEAVIPPGASLVVDAEWEPLDGGRTIPFSTKPGLPLMVGETSVVPLDVPRPAAAGRYRLRLESKGLSLPSYSGEVTIGAQPNPARLLPIRAEPYADSTPVQGVRTGRVALPWRLLDRPEQDVSVGLRLLDASGQEISQNDQALGGSFNIVTDWRPGLVMTTTHSVALPADGLGLYTLRAFLYRPDDPTTYLFLDAAGAPTETLEIPLVIRPESQATVSLPPASPLAVFGDGVYLLGGDVRPPAQRGQPFEVAAGWTTGHPLDASYAVFAHLVDAGGQIIAQQDQLPLGGRYPTTIWEPGEVISDTLSITVPAEAAGKTACLRLGMYDQASLVRLPRRDAPGDVWQPAKCWVLP